MKSFKASLEVQASWKIGVVTARFNAPVTEKLEIGALERLSELGIKPENIMHARVPGAIEIPLVVKAFLAGGCDAVIALGTVIRGETTHYDYVCNAVERGCSELQLTFGRPVAFGVLTTEDGEQALARVGGDKGHKGKECADVVIEMLNLTQQINAHTIK